MRTTVWILVNLENGWDNVIGVYSTEEKAETDRELYGSSDQFIIFERDVD